MKKLIFYFVVMCFARTACGQTFTISPGPTSGPFCSGLTINYAIHVSPGSLPSCTYKWTVTNGLFSANNQTTRSGSNLTNVGVVWNDTHNGGTLKVEVSSCPGNSPNGELVSNNYSIATFFGQTFAQVGSEDALGNVTYGPVNIPYCDIPIISLWVDHMYMNNTGGIGQPALVEAIYKFSLPGGWKQVSTNLEGAIVSTVNSIQITPKPGATAVCANGIVTVQGLVPDSFSCGTSSQNASIQLNRTGSSTLSQSPAYAGPKCGNTTSITFTAPSFSCNPTYAWSFPSGWTGSSSSNSITLTPSGSSSDVGEIKATIFGQCVNALVASYTTPAYVAPAISSSQFICFGGTSVSLLNVLPGITVTWSPSSNMSLVSGQGTSSAVIRAATASTSSLGSINATVTCPNTSVPQKAVWSGIPEPIQIWGDATIAEGQEKYYYVTPYINHPSFEQQGIFSNFEWSFAIYPATGWVLNNGNSAGTWVTAGHDSEMLAARSQNGCGYSEYAYFGVTVPQDCPPEGCEEPFFVYPNPSSSELLVSMNSPSETKSSLTIQESGIILYNGDGNKVFQGPIINNLIKVPVNQLKNGNYYLTIVTKGKAYKKQIIVSH